MHKCGLSPLLSSDCRVLILGSYPSVLSIKAGEYYAHPRNMFWKIMEIILNIPHNQTYTTRISLLLNHGIGLWDVYAACSREKSADAHIKDPVPNELKTLILNHQDIRIIFLNGRAAEKGFRKFFPDISLQTIYLPSSSPAHAVHLEEKIKRWREITRFL